MFKLFPRLGLALLAAVLLSPLPPTAAAEVPLAEFLKKDDFGDIQISPDGRFYAATVPASDRTGLVVMQRSDNAVLAGFSLGKNSHVHEFQWVNPTRVLLSVAQRHGALDEPQPTGELFAVDADGSKPLALVGYRVTNIGHGMRSNSRLATLVAGYLVDDLPNDDRNVIIEVVPFTPDPFTSAELLDVYTGERRRLASVPVQRATFTTDNAGVVRFARGAGIDNVSKLYHRTDADAEWVLVNDEAKSGRLERAVGFAADNRTAYLVVEHSKGPDSIVAMDMQTGERKEVLRDAVADPWQILTESGRSKVPVGAVFMAGQPRMAFFDEDSPMALRYKSLQAAFAPQSVLITSSTDDGSQSVVLAWSDQNPGDFFHFDNVGKRASLLLSRRGWLNPDAMAQRKPVAIKTRDGLTLHGYLTVPPGSNGRNLPLVLLPHGGPFGIFDTWAFDEESQLLAQEGYAVLQVNFRGSGNFGRTFYQAGARQWGGKMQDDLTDATRWAIEQGIAARDRICIYGASYGAYAALMGVVREPELYRCAAGYVGVYDLQLMHAEDADRSRSTATWLNEWLGELDSLPPISPTRLADRIRRPVLLVAGKEDEVAPVEHTKRMEAALRAAGVPVQADYYNNEGHGFYNEENRVAYYRSLLAFLDKHIGTAPAPAAAAATAEEEGQ